MSQKIEFEIKKSGKNQDDQMKRLKKKNGQISFDELVINGSLSPVKVKITSKKKKKATNLTDNLLNDLQCEV